MLNFTYKWSEQKKVDVLSEKRERFKEEELKKNEGAILKFVNMSSDAISPNEMDEVSSASTRGEF